MSEYNQILIKRGLESAIGGATFTAHEIFYTTDTKKIFIADKTATPIHITDVIFSATAPSLTDAKLWMNTGDNQLYRHNGTEWITITPDVDLTDIINDAQISGSTVYSSEKVEELLGGKVDNSDFEDYKSNNNSRSEAIEQSVADEKSRAEGEEARIEAKVDATQSALDTHKTAQATKDGQQDELITGLRTDLTAETEARKSLEGEVGALETKVDDYIEAANGRLDALETETAAIRTSKATKVALQEGLDLKVDKSTLGQANGTATLDSQGYVPLSQINPVYRELRVVEDIAERDAIEPKFEGLMIFVKDGSDDSNVGSGTATYIYDGTEFFLVNKGEDINAVLQWSDIQGKPVSSSADIDDAVSKKHSHDNKEILDATEEAFTTALKTKLDGLENYDDTEVRGLIDDVDAKVDGLETSINTALESKANKDDVYAKTETYSKTEVDNALNTLVVDGGTF